MSGDNPDKSIAEIGQITEKSHWDLRIFAVTQTPVRNNLLTSVFKSQEGVDNGYENIDMNILIKWLKNRAK